MDGHWLLEIPPSPTGPIGPAWRVLGGALMGMSDLKKKVLSPPQVG